MRTAAASGVATKYLARADSRVLGRIGAGYQSFYQLEATSRVMNVADCAIYDVMAEKADNLALVARKRLGLKARVCATAEEVVRGREVLVTGTPCTRPIVKDEWVTEGMHINCVGADAPGKQELELGILKRARIVIDDWEQASHSDEINVPLSRGEIQRTDVCAEIGYRRRVAARQDRRLSDHVVRHDGTRDSGRYLCLEGVRSGGAEEAWHPDGQPLLVAKPRAVRRRAGNHAGVVTRQIRPFGCGKIAGGCLLSLFAYWMPI